MSINTYNPNSPACVNALTQAQLLNSDIDTLIEKLKSAKSELGKFIDLASTGAVISTLSAPKVRSIDELAYALRGTKQLGDRAYMTSQAISQATTVHDNISRLDFE